VTAASDGVRERQTFGEIHYSNVLSENPKGSSKWVITVPAKVIKTQFGRQKTVSQSHHRNNNGSWDGGGPFYTSRTYINRENDYVSLGPKTRSGQPSTYAGPVELPMPSKELSKMADFMKGLGSEDTSGLNPKGATAISLCAPTRSAASLATGLSELVREGSPSLPGIPTWKRRTQLAKAAGDEYLNAVFGWLPLTREVKEVSSSISHSAQIAKQYRRDEGKDVRRRFDFDTVKESSDWVKVGEGKAIVTNGSTSFNDFNVFEEQGNLLYSTSVERRCWFSGAFTYALPSGTDSFSRLLEHGAVADHVIGLQLTPSLLWELTPWSWAVDWFSNTGRVIDNVTFFGQYGLVMRYGYMMEHIIEKSSYMLTNASLYGAHGKPVGPFHHIRETKVRSPANPFGFGVSWQGLSPTQLAITAALGITRL
jgi:hypothetical protein